MSEPSRPPPPKVYTPSRLNESDPDPSQGSEEPPIPPRPPPEVIIDLMNESSSPPKPQRNKNRGTGPPPPPVPYGKKTEQNESNAPPKRVPPPSRPSRPPSIVGPPRPSQAPVSSANKRNSREITIVSAQPMQSDVIPPPSKIDHQAPEKKKPPPKRAPPPPKPSSQKEKPAVTPPEPPQEPTPKPSQEPTKELSTVDDDPPPPSYPAPPPPSNPAPSPPSDESVQYPPKPTSPAPPVPSERVKKPSITSATPISVEQQPNPMDSVVGVTNSPVEGNNNISKPPPPQKSITKPPPPATGKAKPRKPFPTTVNSEESVQTKATETPTAVNDGRGQDEPDASKTTPSTEKDDVSEEVKKPAARKAPPPRKAPPMPTKKEGEEKSPGTTRPKAPPPRKSPSQPIKAVDSKQSPKLSPKTTPTPIKAPPPRKGPPPPTTNKDTPTDKKESPILISKIDNDKPVARAPPPKKGPPPPPSKSTPPTDSASIPKKPAPRAPPPRKSVTDITKEDSSPKLRPQTSPGSGRGKPPSPKLKSVDTHNDSVHENASATNSSSSSNNKSSPTVGKSSKPSKPSPPSAAPRNTKPAPPKPGPPKPTPPNPSAAKQGPPKPGPPKPGPPKPGPPKPGPPKPSAAPRKPSRSGPVPTKRSTTSDKPPSLPPRPTPGHPLYKYVCSEPHGIATSNKEAEEADELSYMEGDVIELIEKIDDYWFWARNADNDGAEGLVIVNDMKIVKRLPGEDKLIEDGPCAVATSSFEARQGDELSFNSGDLIMLISCIGNGEWLRGRTMHGVEGIFPKSFVEIVEELPADAVEEIAPEPSPEKIEAPDGPYCVAVDTFEGETPDDLSFHKGDIIILTERIDDSWLRGTLDGRSGMFPQVFVDVCVDIPVGVVSPVVGAAPSVGEDSVSIVATAVFDFEGQSEEELTFKIGDTISVTHRINEEWVYGSLGGAEGMFPIAFIDTVPDNLPMKSDKKEDSTDTSTETTATMSPTTGKCEATHDFEADNAGDLAFTIGEIIITTEWVNDEWMCGRVGEREGMFPLAFVKVIDELSKEVVEVENKKSSTSKKSESSSSKTSESSSSKTSGKGGTSDDLLPKGVALSDFNPADSSEIFVKKGDEMYLLSKETSKMYLGENIRTGDIGNFPINIIQVTTPLP